MTTEPRRAPVLALAGIIVGLAVIATLSIVYFNANPRAAEEPGRFAMLNQSADDVVLTDSTDATVRWGDLEGTRRLLFFGFTHCPEICPTTIADIDSVLRAIGPDADGVRVEFVSVDPARDTPEQLAAYFQSFGPRYRGYTGDRAEIDKLAAAFHVFYEHVPTTGDDYTVNHTAITYLIDENGEVVDIMGYQTPHDRALAQVRDFLS